MIPVLSMKIQLRSTLLHSNEYKSKLILTKLMNWLVDRWPPKNSKRRVTVKSPAALVIRFSTKILQIHTPTLTVSPSYSPMTMRIASKINYVMPPTAQKRNITKTKLNRVQRSHLVLISDSRIQSLRLAFNRYSRQSSQYQMSSFVRKAALWMAIWLLWIQSRA